MPKILPVHADLFSDYGPMLYFGIAPYAYGWRPKGELTESILAELDQFGVWQVDEDGLNVLINRYATCQQIETELGKAQFVVLGPSGEFLFAVYGNGTMVQDTKYDPRQLGTVLELSEDEFDRRQDSNS